MYNIIKQLLGLTPKVDYATLVKRGALIIDVRTQAEYATGHIEGALNIAVDTLTSHLDQFKGKDQPIITCCASGIRSETAKNILAQNGYTQVYNGGGWRSLQDKI